MNRVPSMVVLLAAGCAFPPGSSSIPEVTGTPTTTKTTSVVTTWAPITNIETATLRPLDILLVIDNSCGMTDDQQTFNRGVDDLLAPVLVDGSDVHLGLVTTSGDDLPDQNGKLQPGPDGARYLATTDPVMGGDWVRAAVLLRGEQGSGSEQALGMSLLALSDPGPVANAGFLRPDSDIAVIFVTDEPDYSAVTVDEWVDWFDDLTADRGRGSVHTFGTSISTQANGLAAEYGGVVANLGTYDVEAESAEVGEQIVPAYDGVIELSALPDPATIVVTATEPGGAVVTLTDGVDYDYDAVANAVILTGYVPPLDTQIAVTYTP